MLGACAGAITRNLHVAIRKGLDATSSGNSGCKGRLARPEELSVGHGHSCQVRIPLGDDEPADPEAIDWNVHPTPRCAVAEGFNLHANVIVPARDRLRLERLARYVSRPPIASERLTELADGRLSYELRHRWRDGYASHCTSLVFSMPSAAGSCLLIRGQRGISGGMPPLGS